MEFMVYQILVFVQPLITDQCVLMIFANEVHLSTTDSNIFYDDFLPTIIDHGVFLLIFKPSF
jgi:hypothetical protein